MLLKVPMYILSLMLMQQRIEEVCLKMGFPPLELVIPYDVVSVREKLLETDLPCKDLRFTCEWKSTNCKYLHVNYDYDAWTKHRTSLQEYPKLYCK